METRKVGIIGAGHVGSHVAYALMALGIVDEVYLADIDKEKGIAQAMDLNDAVTYLPNNPEACFCRVEDMGQCDAVVFCAGPLPEPGETRLEGLPRTIEVCKDVIPRLKKLGFKGFIVSISNPCDIVAHYLQIKLDWPAHMIVGTSTGLDSSRLLRCLYEKYHVNRRSIEAFGIGEHGGSAVVPLSCASIYGKPLRDLWEEQPDRFPKIERAAYEEAMKQGGWIVFSGKHSTEFGIGTTAAEIIRAYFRNLHKVMPCSVLVNGQYGEKDVFTSVPAILGAHGVEGILEYPLEEGEEKDFHASNDLMREYLKQALDM